MSPGEDSPRLVFVNRFFHPDHSATSQLLSDLAFALARRGARVHVVASRLTYGNERALAATERHESGVEVTRVASTGFGRGALPGRFLDYVSFMASARSAVARIATPGSVVIAKTDPPLLGSALAGAVGASGAVLVNWVQDLFPELAQAAGMPAGVMRPLRDRALARAAATVAVGESMAARLRALDVAPAGSVHVIPNWADGVAIAPRPPQASALRAAAGLGGRFVVGYSGNLGRVHEFATTIAAARELRGEGAVRFLFSGAGRRLPEVERARQEGLDNLVLVAYQPREALADVLAAADVHLCTLDPAFEGLVVPSKLYGIMAAGRPCLFVGDPDGEVGRLVRDERIGVAVRPGDARALVAAIRALAVDEPQRRAMGAAARRLFEREYDLPLAVARWERLLGSVAARAA